MNFLAGLILTCLVQYNGADVISRQVQFEPGIQMISIGEVAEYQLMIKDMGNQSYELQAFNQNEPSRSYATAKIEKASDQLRLSIWKREHWLEVVCSY